MSLEIPDYPFVVIGVDPGGTTGISVVGVEADKPASIIETRQWPNDYNPATWQKLQSLAHHYRALYDLPVVLVIEQFDKRPGVIDPDYSAMYINKDIVEYIHEYPIVWQIPAAAKNLIKPARKGKADQLKRFGWYQVSHRHANDASRHVLVYLVEKVKHRPTILKGWPKR